MSLLKYFTKTALVGFFVLKIVGAIVFDLFLTKNVVRRFNFKETTPKFYDFYLLLAKMTQILKQVVSVRAFVSVGNVS